MSRRDDRMNIQWDRPEAFAILPPDPAPHPPMCLAVPGRIVEITEAAGIRMARLDFGGIQKQVCLAYLPDAVVGDYAIVHVGFAISRIDEASAQETLRQFRELGVLEEELGEAPPEAYRAPASCPVPPQVA